MIDLETLLAATEKVVNANPDKVVEHCIYTNEDGSPCCVIGYVLDELGLPRPEGDGENGKNARVTRPDGWTSLSDNHLTIDVIEYGNFFDTPAMVFATKLQQIQDEEVPWSEAFRIAKHDLGIK
jgi:hypothetical protein